MESPKSGMHLGEIGFLYSFGVLQEKAVGRV